jgi:prepilin-type N-terminal cleavage/methylation domain-containing protein/prepilin-type processing-associated H-X9-DG protein
VTRFRFAQSSLRQRRPRGFTLIELLVVIAIVSLIMALAISGVVTVQRRAVTFACQNNFRAVGQACWTYVSARGAFPHGGGPSVQGSKLNDNPKEWSWLYRIVPYLDGNDSMLVTKLENGAVIMPEVRQARVGVFFCPANVGVRSIRNDVYNFAGSSSFGGADIAGNIGSRWPFEDGCQGPLPPIDGVIAPIDNARVTQFSIRDGLSTTFLASEKRQVMEELESGAQTAGNAIGWTAGLPCDPRIRSGGDTLRQPVADWGRNLLRTPPSSVRLIDKAVGSGHAEGVVCLFCDGSVRLLPFDTDQEVRRSLATRAAADRIDPQGIIMPEL